MNRTARNLAGLVIAVLAFTAACGDDTTDTTDAVTTEATDTVDDEATETTDAVEDEAPETTDTAPPDDGSDDGAGGTDPGASLLDTNGDGEVVFGIATPGPRDDGAYYQALVEGVEAFSTERGFADPIVVDNIEPGQAETELRNLARQDVDVIAVGASEIADPLVTLTEEFSDVFWYCNCGAGFPVSETLAQSNDDASEISYTAGYATGLLMRDQGVTQAAFIGCCDLDFEREAFQAFELGLTAVDDSFTWTYVPTGDFNDVAAATEAFNQALADGVGAVYPYLGGAHEAVVQLANENDVIVMSAGASDVCDRTDLDYDLAIQFDAGDYLDTLLEQMESGEFTEGEVFTFRVGEYDFVGAELCDGTEEQVAALEIVETEIVEGAFDEDFTAIKSEVYGF